jgi:hypothetical protein
MDFLPGYLQGITRVIISFPFDNIKLHMQTNKINSMCDFFKHNSYKTLYRGSQISFITVPIERAIQYKCFESMNERFNPFISGASCGAINAIITLPVSYVRTNYILSNNKLRLYEFTCELLKDGKYKNIMNGFKPELARSFLGASTYLGIYGNMRNKYGYNLKQSIINSSVAGICMWTITFPFDTLRVEQQKTGKKIADILKQRINNYGVLNFWKGIYPVYVKTIPSSACGMIVYEKCRNHIDRPIK